MLIAQKPPEQYIAYKVEEHIHLDGKASEASWKQAPWSRDFIDIEGKVKPKYRTRMKMLWDEQYLYIFAQMQEPHVWGTLTQRDAVMYHNNDFEVFIDPDGDTHNYYELEMNALNTVWDLFLDMPYRNGGKPHSGWDIEGLRTAVDIQGSLNDPTDTDTGWSVEIAIPFSFYLETDSTHAVLANSFWRINFSRVNWEFELTEGEYTRKKDASGKRLPEYNWVWSPQWVINMHCPEHWGYVFFSPEQPGARTEFSLPADEHIKWYLYELYRRVRGIKQNTGDWEQNVAALLLEKNIQGKKVFPELKPHASGWELLIKSPFSDQLMRVDEKGKFNMSVER